MKRRGRKKIEGISHRTSFLKSVERTLDVLELLSKQRSIGITELAHTMKIANSTAHRILTTLEKKGFAVQNPKSGRYALGHMVFQLTKSVIHMIEPIKYVRPYLEELCKKIGENIAFAVVVPSQNQTLVLAEKVADRAVVAKSTLFEQFPIHVCSCGKAYLLTLNNQQLKAVLAKNDLTQFTKHTVTSLPRLKKQLTQFRRLGYTLSHDEFSVGLSSMASAIFDVEDKFAGAIVVIGPSFRFTDENIKSWDKLLSQATARLSLEFKARGIGVM
jgi:IclR family acetate operon transcriptional repressor